MEKYALQGDKNEGKTQETTTLRGNAARQHAVETPPLRQAAVKLSLAERLMVLLHIKKKATQDRAYSGLYNVRVTASLLNELSQNGIANIHELEEKLTDLENQCMETVTQMRTLENDIVKQESLWGAALNCQANREVFEQYENKILFKENFFKIHRKAIEAFTKGREELRAAGVPEEVTPVQLRNGLERLKLRRRALNDELKRQRGEHEHWSRKQEQVKNIMESKPPKAERRQPEQQKKQKAPNRESRGR